jgi:hypothetical protein
MYYVFVHFPKDRDTLRVFPDIFSAYKWALEYAETWDSVSSFWSREERAAASFKERCVVVPFAQVKLEARQDPMPIIHGGDLQVCIGFGSPTPDYMDNFSENNYVVVDHY